MIVKLNESVIKNYYLASVHFWSNFTLICKTENENKNDIIGPVKAQEIKSDIFFCPVIHLMVDVFYPEQFTFCLLKLKLSNMYIMYLMMQLVQWNQS